MAKHSIDMVIKARDEASKQLMKVGGAVTSMSGMIKKAAVAAATYFSVREVVNFSKSALQSYGEQEKASVMLGRALESLGRKSELPEMEKFAELMQKQTVHADEEILKIMKLGTTIGGLFGDNLKDATRAAIGLASAYDMDLNGAMEIVAKGAAGVKVRLAGLGIEVDKNASDLEIYNRILEKANAGFKIAREEIKTYLGTVAQMRNAYDEVKESIGAALMPTFKESAERIKEWAENNQDRIGKWAKSAVNFVTLVKDAIADFINYMKNDFTGGLRWAFDSFVKIMQTTFKTMIQLAWNAGSAIGQAISQGLKINEEINTAALKKYSEAGGYSWSKTQLLQNLQSQGKNEAEARNIVEKNFTKIVAGGLWTPNQYIPNSSQDIYGLARQQALSEASKFELHGLINGLLNSVTENFKTTFEQIGKSTPPGLKAAVEKSLDKFWWNTLDDQVKKAIEIAEGFNPATGSFYGDLFKDKAQKPQYGPRANNVAAAYDQPETKKKQSDRQPDNPAFMRGHLTMAPGARIDPSVDIAKNTKDSTAYLAKIWNKINKRGQQSSQNMFDWGSPLDL